MIVADPRRTDTAEAWPTCTCQLLPGTDVMLHHGLLHVMLWEGWTDARLHRRPHQRLRRAEGDWCATARRPRGADLRLASRRAGRALVAGDSSQRGRAHAESCTARA
jgi:hypothetical protein